MYRRSLPKIIKISSCLSKIQLAKVGAFLRHSIYETPATLFKGNISVAHCMPLSVWLKGSRMMSPPGSQTTSASLTLIFDLLTPEVDRSCLCRVRRFMTICIEIGSFVFILRRSQVGNRRRNEQTDRRTEEGTGRAHYASGQSRLVFG